MPIQRLTSSNVAALEPRPGEAQTDFWDLLLPRFGVRVGRRRARSTWQVRYSLNGQKRRDKIGFVLRMGLADARRKADAILEQVDQGRDPRLEPSTHLKALTFADLVDAYRKGHGERKRSWSTDRTRIERDLIPVFGHKSAAAVSDADVQGVMDAMIARGVTVGASRTFETVRAIFNWAKRTKLVTQNPTDGMDKPFKTGRRDRYLTESELRRFWAELNSAAEKDAAIVAVLTLMLLTAQRQGEIRRMQWRDLDIERGWWNAPGERTKTGRPYRIALTPRALATIEAFRGRHETFVFPCRSGNGPLLPFDVNHWVRGARARAGIKDFVPHDIRHTVATSLARMGVRDEVIARVLNHAPQVPLTAKYIEHTYDDEKRRALQAWERQLLEIAGEANPGRGQRSGKTNSRAFPGARHTFAQQSDQLSARPFGPALASARLESR